MQLMIFSTILSRRCRLPGELHTDEYFKAKKDGREAKQHLQDAVETLTAYNDAHNQYEKDLKRQLQRVNQ
jgi:hypothetical protein